MSVRLDDEHFTVATKHIQQEIPHYPIDAPIEGDARTPLYEMISPMARLTDSEFVLLRRYDTTVELQLNDTAMNVKWRQPLTFQDEEYLANLSLMNGRIAMVNNRYTKGDSVVAMLRLFDPQGGRGLETRELDRAPGNVMWLGNEHKTGCAPYSVYFSPDSSHMLLFARDYSAHPGALTEQKPLSFHAVILDSGFRRIGALDIPAHLGSDKDMASGIWPSRRGYIYSAARRSSDSLWMGRYDPRDGSLIERTFVLARRRDGSAAREIGLDITLTTNQQDEAIVAFTGVIPGTQEITEIDLVKFSPDKGSIDTLASYAPSPSTIADIIDSSSGVLDNYRIRDIVQTPNGGTLVMLEQIYFDMRFAPRDEWHNEWNKEPHGKSASIISTLVRDEMRPKGYSFGPLLVVAFDQAGRNIWASGFEKVQFALRKQGFVECGFRRYLEGDSLLHILYFDRSSDQGLVWQKIQLSDGKKRMAYSPISGASEYLRNFTIWTNRARLIVTAVEGNPFGSDPDVGMYSISPKGSVLNDPE